MIYGMRDSAYDAMQRSPEDFCAYCIAAERFGIDIYDQMLV